MECISLSISPAMNYTSVFFLVFFSHFQNFFCLMTGRRGVGPEVGNLALALVRKSSLPRRIEVEYKMCLEF